MAMVNYKFTRARSDPLPLMYRDDKNRDQAATFSY